MASVSSTKPAPLNHAATFAVRAAEELLDKADARIARKGRGETYPSLEAAMLATLQTPQYRRTYIQGCACSTGIAGGGCCSGSATLGQSGAAMQGGHAAAMAPMGILSGALGAYGVYSGVKVLRNTSGALQNLSNVENYVMPQIGEAALLNAQVARYDTMPRTREAAEHTLKALLGFKRDLKVSTQEQLFNRAVPGVLQVGAASVVTLSAVNELGMGFLGALGGTVVGALGAGLFAVYGGLMAAKNLLSYRDDKAIKPIDRSEGLPDDYRLAVNTHLTERLNNKLQTGLAWSGVGLAGVFGAVVAAGAVAFPFAWAAVAGVALVAAGWAMWQNSRTRYVPHLPISSHVQRDQLVSPEQRATTWKILAEQDRAIKAAVSLIADRQTRTTRFAYQIERLFKPQCGPKAFRVLSNAVHTTRGKGELEQTLLRGEYEQIQLNALATYVSKERELLMTRFKDKSDELLYRVIEMKRLVDPCCDAMTATAHEALAPGALTEAVYTQASDRLRDEAADLEMGARKLAVLDQLSDAIASLQNDVGSLQASDDTALTASQKTWVYVRLNVLQLSGTLGDAVTAKFIGQHPEHFSRNFNARALPINNIYVLPEQIDKFATNIAAELEGAFVHAFFNPRRIEGEMDFILDHELSGRKAAPGDASRAAPAAPKCDGGTCCR